MLQPQQDAGPEEIAEGVMEGMKEAGEAVIGAGVNVANTIFETQAKLTEPPGKNGDAASLLESLPMRVSQGEIRARNERYWDTGPSTTGGGR